MPVYPIHVPREFYRGRDPRRQRKVDGCNRIAEKVERWINDRVAAWPDDTIGVFYSATIAAELREDPKLVGDVVFRIDCGSNGVTVRKGDAERALAKRKNAPAAEPAA